DDSLWPVLRRQRPLVWPPVLLRLPTSQGRRRHQYFLRRLRHITGPGSSSAATWVRVGPVTNLQIWGALRPRMKVLKRIFVPKSLAAGGTGTAAISGFLISL